MANNCLIGKETRKACESEKILVDMEIECGAIVVEEEKLKNENSSMEEKSQVR